VTAVGRQHFRRSWRGIHRYVSYPASGFAIVHTFFGTDLAIIGFSGVGLALVGVSRFMLRDDAALVGEAVRGRAEPRRALIRGVNARTRAATLLSPRPPLVDDEHLAAKVAAQSCPSDLAHLHSHARGFSCRTCSSERVLDARLSGFVSEEPRDASSSGIRFALALQSFVEFVEDLRQ
jgi:hypothetical protein